MVKRFGETVAAESKGTPWLRNVKRENALEQMNVKYSEIAIAYDKSEKARKKLGAEVVSVSTDKVETHKAWHDSSPAIQKVNYPMIADPTGKLCREFGVYIEDEGIALPCTFIIDPRGILKTMQINANSIGRSTDELLRTLRAAIYVDKHPGLVCPASWDTGKEALKPGMDLVGKI